MFLTDSESQFPPRAVIEIDNNVIYSSKLYGGEILLSVSRHKGSTGFVKVTWGISIEPNAPASFIVSPMVGILEFSEGQWNSSFHLQFPSLPATDKKIEIYVKLLNVSDGAILGDFTTVKITFPPKKVNPEHSNNNKNVILKIVLPYSGGVLVVIGLAIVIAFLYRRHRKR